MSRILDAIVEAAKKAAERPPIFGVICHPATKAKLEAMVIEANTARLIVAYDTTMAVDKCDAYFTPHEFEAAVAQLASRGDVPYDILSAVREESHEE